MMIFSNLERKAKINNVYTVMNFTKTPDFLFYHYISIYTLV